MFRVMAIPGEQDALLKALDVRVRQVAREEALKVAEARPALASADVMDEGTCAAVRELVLLSHKVYFTRGEAAKYLQVSEKSIGEWSRQPAEENPLPVAYAGADPRYKRAALDEWAAEEARRRLAG